MRSLLLLVICISANAELPLASEAHTISTKRHGTLNERELERVKNELDKAILNSINSGLFTASADSYRTCDNIEVPIDTHLMQYGYRITYYQRTNACWIFVNW